MLSVIIPTLNAEPTLAATLESVARGGLASHDMEVWIIDGGSTDATQRIAHDHGAHWLAATPGRGRQLAAGSGAAAGEWLLFVHGDSRLPSGWGGLVEAFMADGANAHRAAYFQLAFDDAGPPARRVAWLANARARWLGLPYGDQGLLIAKPFYQSLGGYRPELDLMEDVALVRRIGYRHLGALPAPITTSAVRYRRDGWWARPVKNLICLMLYFLGASQALLKRAYR